MEEGVIFDFLTNPRAFRRRSGHGQGHEVVQMELGEPDASGRRSPCVKSGSEHIVDVDTVVIAVGTVPNPSSPPAHPSSRPPMGTMSWMSEAGQPWEGVWREETSPAAEQR